VELGTGRNDVIIAIVDDGVDYGHGDLDPGDRSHVIQGYDTADQDSDPRDDIPFNYGGGHGTSVAGLVGALTNNNRDVAGVMWNCQLLPVKVAATQPPWWCHWPFNCVGEQFDWDVADGIRYAAQHGANVINISFGGPGPAWYEQFRGADPITMASYTAFRLGAVPVASMGNTDTECDPCYPAGFPWVLAVGATGQDSARASFSLTGPHIGISAPGENVLTTSRYSGTGLFSGTSAASPVAAGAAGLLLAEGRDWGVNLTNEDVVEILKRTATDLVRPGVGWDQFTGHGLVNAKRALERLNPPYTVQQGSGVGGTVTLTWGPHTHNFMNNDDLPAGQCYGVSQYEVRRRIDFCGPYAATPDAWGRTRQSVGWSPANPNYEFPWTEVLNVTATGFDVRTFVYHIPYDLSSRHVDWWYPSRPEHAVTAWTILGNIPLQSAVISGPHAECGVTLNADCCGGALDRGFEWYERPAGGTWSGVVGTTPTYTRVLPYLQDMEFKVVVRSGGAALVDTHFVTYQTCLVSAEPQSVKELRFAVSPNPTRGRVHFSVDVPREQHVTLSVFDVNGRLVERIADQVLSPGPHRFEWAVRDAGGSRVSSGLYFARLTTASGKKTARIVIAQ
jgi:hypothetical protein